MRAPKFLYPKFYIKAVGGQYSITHRLTHCYIETVKSEEELVERMKYWVGLDDKELWRYMVKECYQPIPREKSLIFYQQNKKDEEEEWFISAWSVYTDLFYTKHSELFVEEKEFPIDAIREFRREEYERKQEEDERAKREREEAERRYKEEERKVKENAKKKVEEVQEGKIGSISAIEKLKRKARRNIKKVKAKANSVKQIVILDSDDLFA